MAATDGGEAIVEYRRAADAGAPFDLLVVDLTIPGGMGGLEAFTRIRELDPDARAIVFSGYSEDPVLAEYRKHGFRAALSKPFNVSALRRAVALTLADAEKSRSPRSGN